MNTPPWFRQRFYAHFDARPTPAFACEYASSPTKVARHGFFPLIMRPIKTYHFKTGPDGRRCYHKKVRPITYAAHLDTHIHARYAFELSLALEQRYLNSELGKCVLAYRKHSPPRCNIDFALEAFAEIAEKGNCDVVAIDVDSFFDSLDHAILKEAWCGIRGESRLREDHFAVFRSITKDYAIPWPSIRLALGNKQRRRAGVTGAPICPASMFRKVIAPLAKPRHAITAEVKGIQPSSTPRGIPQGSAISATLANLYMLSTDLHLLKELGEIGASYRRYSDDILVIAPPGKGEDAAIKLEKALAKVMLQTKKDKTELHEVRATLNDASMSSLVREDGPPIPNRPIRYLGLSFNGTSVSIKDSTVSRFLMATSRAIKAAVAAAKASASERVALRKVYATKSWIGAGQAYGEWRTGDGRAYPPTKAPRMGFPSYLKRAILKARLTNLESFMEKQNSNGWQRLHTMVAMHTRKPGPSESQ